MQGSNTDSQVLQCEFDVELSLSLTSRWVFPMCGGKPLHWVLGWVDFGTYEIRLFDSIPELASHSWAIPVSKMLYFSGSMNLIHQQLLLKVIATVLEYAKKDVPDFNKKPWKKQVYSPTALQRQMDLWSCGLFLLMAMWAYIMKEGFEKVCNDEKEKM